jgi:phosphate transport system substrate-binding protein
MKLKSFLVAAAGSAVLAGTVLGIAGPAAADPAAPTTVAGGGSDTTQDVMDAIAKSISGTANTIGSWNAILGTSVHGPITPKSTAACTDISRPNGSGEGVTALRRSLSGTTGYPATTTATYAAGTGATVPALGSQCFDFGRSSSGPGANAAPTDGLLQYVPFALDGVTMAVGPATGTSATQITGSFDLAELQSMYSTGTPAVGSDGVTYDPNPADGVTGTPIHLLVPQSGSGTRNFFAGVMGINATTLPAWVSDQYTPTGSTTPASVQEHDGTAVQLDHNAIMPFSTAQWIAQATGHSDRRHGAVLQTVSGVAPIDANGKLNESFPSALLREVYNVIPFSATTATGTTLFNIFVSPSTLNPNRVCGRTSLITEYGFGLLTNAPKGHTCGQISSDLRAFNTTQW